MEKIEKLILKSKNKNINKDLTLRSIMLLANSMCSEKYNENIYNGIISVIFKNNLIDVYNGMVEMAFLSIIFPFVDEAIIGENTDSIVVSDNAINNIVKKTIVIPKCFEELENAITTCSHPSVMYSISRHKNRIIPKEYINKYVDDFYHNYINYAHTMVFNCDLVKYINKELNT